MIQKIFPENPSNLVKRRNFVSKLQGLELFFLKFNLFSASHEKWAFMKKINSFGTVVFSFFSMFKYRRFKMARRCVHI